MQCAECGARGGVVETRQLENGAVRRRYACVGCGVRFTTYELVAAQPPSLPAERGAAVLRTRRLEKGLTLQNAWLRIAAAGGAED